jgi:hypothetical protein
VDIGPSTGYKFHEWDVDGFKKNIMGHWMKFLAETAERQYLGLAEKYGMLTDGYRYCNA